MKKIVASLLGLAFLGCTFAYDRQDDPPSPAARRSPGLRASVLLRESIRGQPPLFREVSTGEMFYSGEQFRLRFRSDRGGYLYVLLRNADGQSQLLFPQREEVESGDYHLRGSQVASFPRDACFRFDNHAGTEHLWALLSDRRIPSLDTVAMGDTEMTSGLLRQYTSGVPLAAKGIGRSDGDGSDGDGEGLVVMPMRITHLPR